MSVLAPALLIGTAFESAPAQAVSPIQHIVIIDEENHSFNDLLGKLCVEQSTGEIIREGLNQGCVGTSEGIVKGPDGTTTPYTLTSESDTGLETLCHKVHCQRVSIDGGAMDGFTGIRGCMATSTPAYGCLTQLDPLSGPCASVNGSCIPNLAAYAVAYAISDHTFELRATPSFAGHMVLASASIERFGGNNPRPFLTPGGQGWGCDSGDLTEWRVKGEPVIQVPSCIPDASGSLGDTWAGYTGATPAYYEPTIFDRMDAAGVSWKIYGGFGEPSGIDLSYEWTMCPTFWECLGGPQRANEVAASQILADAQAGTLPAVSFVTPTVANSGHPPQAISAADNWVGDVVSAIQSDPKLWGSTAIFVTFDDCGCFYDPVNPLQYNGGWGVRVPMLIISPFARAGYTDASPATFASLLTFVEHTFSLTPLNPCATVDSWATRCTDDLRGPVVHGRPTATYDYANAFDFSQPPLPPVDATHTPLTRAQRTFLQNHPNAGSEAT